MKITVIHGQSHKGSTYNVAKEFCDKLGGEGSGCFCKGCTACLTDETKCPDYEKLKPIIDAIDNADVIIL